MRAVQRACSAYDAGTANVRRSHSGLAARSHRPTRADSDTEDGGESRTLGRGRRGIADLGEDGGGSRTLGRAPTCNPSPGVDLGRDRARGGSRWLTTVEHPTTPTTPASRARVSRPRLALLRHVRGRRAPVRRGAWQAGQRGSQRAMARAIASRMVAKLSAKWRSGRERLRVVFQRPSGRGGKMPHTFGNDERVAA